MKKPCVYILTNKRNGVLYTGVTSDLTKRIYEHKNNFVSGFTKKYNCKFLVFFEPHFTMETAIQREKQIKKGPRKRKVQLIETMNPEWKDLYESIYLLKEVPTLLRSSG